MQNLWRETRRAAGMLLACAMLASMIPAQALAAEADEASLAQTEGTAQTQTVETNEMPPVDDGSQTENTVTDSVTETPVNPDEETAPSEEPAPEQQPSNPEETAPVVTETPAETVTPEATEIPEVTESPEATEAPAETEAPDAGEQMPEIQTMALDPENLSEKEAVEYTLTVKFHECVSYLDDWKWVHQVRTTTITVDEENIDDYWNMDAARLANAVVGYDAFSPVDFWMGGADQPVVSGSGTDWTVELYVNLHAWGRVPGSYAQSQEEGNPWDGNLVCSPTYQIQNRSTDLTVGYAFHNMKGSESGTLASGESLQVNLAGDGAAAAIFFLKAPAGYTGNGVTFSDGTAGDVYPIDQISHWQGIYNFTTEIAWAKYEGYTHAFYFTQWSGEERRWFSVDVVPETYDVTYHLDGGVLSASNPLTYDVTELEDGGIPLHNPTKTGYTFLGWTRDGSTGAATTAMAITPGTVGNLSFTAHWQIRSDLSYTVQYLEKDTDKVLADAKTVDGQTYNTAVTEEALSIDGYRLVGEETQTLTVDVPENGDNTLVFYYEAVAAGTEENPSDTGNTGNNGNNNGNPSGNNTGNTGSNGNNSNQAAGNQEADTAENVQASAAQAALAVPAGLPLVTGPAAGTVTRTNPQTLPDNEAPAAQEPAEEEVVPETDTPLAQAPAEQETIGNSETPLAASNGGWALLNLILAAVTVLGGVLLLALGNKHNAWRLAGLIPALAAIVAFLVTENLSMSMVFADRWTLLMALIVLIQAGIAVLSRKGEGEDTRA